MPRTILAVLLVLLLGALLAPSAARAHAGHSHDEDTLLAEGAVTHGDTPADFGELDIAAQVRLARLTTPSLRSATVADSLATTWCGTARTTDDTENMTFAADLPQFKVVYAYPADRPNRFAQWADNLQANASLIVQFVSSQMGSSRAPRFDLGTTCGPSYVDIQTVALPGSRASYLNNFGAVRSAVAARVNQAPGGKRNYLILADTLHGGSGILGQGEMFSGGAHATRPDADNIHNNGGLSSIIWYPDQAAPQPSANGWLPTIFLHEMGHNLGAVQWTAPHSSQPAGGSNYVYSHCWDGYDVMCYQDGPNMSRPYQTTSCDPLGGAMYQTFDCGQDDYFNPAPAPGSYLDTSWNTYNSIFLADCGTLQDGSCMASVGQEAPVNTMAPGVSGTPLRGNQLMATSGGWEPYPSRTTFQWERTTGAGWVAITGATAQSYRLVSADVGASVRVRVTARNPYGAASAVSTTVGPVAGLLPSPTANPVVSGATARGSKLTTTTGTWTNTPTSYTYQWQRNTGSGYADIAGATTAAYTTTVADVGARIRARVTARNADGGTTTASNDLGPVVAAPPASTAPPVVTGTAARAVKLTATAGSWAPAGTSYAFQWQRRVDGTLSDIAGATSSSYTPVAGDIGATLRVRVTATNADGPTAAYSTETAPVAPSPPAITTAPAVSGKPHTGAVLSSTTGSWRNAPTAYARRWQRDSGSGFADIAGATAATYTLTDADLDARVRVVVTATNADGPTDAPSAAVGPVVPTPRATAAPAVSGTVMEGATLTATPGTWTPSGTASTYLWLRCSATATVTANCSSTGRTGASYVATVTDVGKKLAVRVTGTAAGAAGTADSEMTDVVEGRPLTSTGAPQITGTVMLQEPLRASAGTWSVPTSSVAYQWRRCAADGSACADITGARAAAYTPVAADVGRALVARVTATSPGRTATAESEPTAAVAPQPLPEATTAPDITGTAARAQTLRVGTGAWTGRPSSYTYQWRRCAADGSGCTDIPGATRTTYLLGAEDTGHAIRVLVGALNATGTGTTETPATAEVAEVSPVNRTLPALSGTWQVGGTVRVSAGGWATTPDTTYAYRWERCAPDGSGCAVLVTTTTYKLVAADAGSVLKATVTATNADGAASATSALSPVVKPPKPSTTALPTITGTPSVGGTVTVTAGTWLNATSLTARVFRCTTSCVAVGDVGSRTYAPKAADVGYRLRGQETAIGLGGTTAVWTATMSTPVVSAGTGLASVAVGGTATATTPGGTPLATVTVSGTAKAAAAAGKGRTVRVTVRRRAAARGKLELVACPLGDVWAPCTKPERLGATVTRMSVRLPAGARKVALTVRRARR